MKYAVCETRTNVDLVNAEKIEVHGIVVFEDESEALIYAEPENLRDDTIFIIDSCGTFYNLGTEGGRGVGRLIAVRSDPMLAVDTLMQGLLEAQR